jgi:agmatine deiminase
MYARCVSIHPVTLVLYLSLSCGIGLSVGRLHSRSADDQTDARILRLRQGVWDARFWRGLYLDGFQSADVAPDADSCLDSHRQNWPEPIHAEPNPDEAGATPDDLGDAFTPPLTRTLEASGPEGFREANPGLYSYTPSPPGTVRLAAEHEPVDAIYYTWKPGLYDELMATLTQITVERTNVKPFVLHSGVAERRYLVTYLTDIGVDIPKVTFLDATDMGPYFSQPGPASAAWSGLTPWLADWGPLFVSTGRERLAIVDLSYTGKRVNDDAVPTKLARYHGLPVYRPEMEFDGGNILSDGAGTCFAAYRMDDASSQPPPSEAQNDRLRKNLGCQKVIWLDALVGEPTGHIDMFLKVAPDNTLLLGQYAPAIDEENAELLDNHARRLLAARSATGSAYRVVRVPMPDNLDGVYRTYLNSVVINQVVLVPTYHGHSRMEPAVLAAHRTAFPGRQVILVPADDIIRDGGALHCITRTRPAPPTGHRTGWRRRIASITRREPPLGPLRGNPAVKTASRAPSRRPFAVPRRPALWRRTPR